MKKHITDFFSEEFSTKNGILANVGRTFMLAGFVMVGLAISWWVACGTMLMFWGNNMGLVAGFSKSLPKVLDHFKVYPK